jgi:hypothetical protein
MTTITTTAETTTAPFVTEFVIRLLTLGPTLRDAVPTDPATNAEIRAAWGARGERLPETWRVHGEWLRAAARERNIQPRWGRDGQQFFAQAAAGR